jgi:uncharacterized membrane protein
MTASNHGLADRAVFSIAGGALLYMGIRSRGAGRLLWTTLGADLLRRACAGLTAGRRTHRRMDRKLDEMSMQSFPASDPPAY